MVLKNTPATTMRLIAALCLGLTACGSTKLDPNRMSDEEIFAYNETVQYSDQIRCEVGVRADSFIRKRRCFTMLEWQESTERTGVQGSLSGQEAPVRSLPMGG